MKIDERYFQPDPNHDPMSYNHIEDLLTDEETLLWEGKPKKSAYIAAAVFRMLPVALIWLLFDGGIIALMLTQIGYLPWFMWVFFAFHLLPVWFWIGGILHAVAEIKNIEYAITDKRILIRSGVTIDLKTIYFTDINSVNVKVGLIDRMYKVGDIYITASMQTAVLYDITDPYRVVNFIQGVVRDIQTDIHFPNAYRPKENPGFNTSYKGRKK